MSDQVFHLLIDEAQYVWLYGTADFLIVQQACVISAHRHCVQRAIVRPSRYPRLAICRAVSIALLDAP